MKAIIVCLVFLELKLNKKQGTAKERSHLFIFIKCIKLLRKETMNLQIRKTSWKIEENKLTVFMKIILWELRMYSKFTFTYRNNDKNKTNFITASTQFTVPLIAGKLVSLWLWNFHAFSFFLLTVLRKRIIIAWVNYFIMQIWQR